MKKLFLILLLLSTAVGVCYALNIAYQNDTGDILELDNADVTRFTLMNDPNISTGTVTSSQIVSEPLPIDQIYYDQVTKQVKTKASPEAKTSKRKKLIRRAIQLQQDLFVLREIAKTETINGITKEINKSTTTIQAELDDVIFEIQN